MISFEPLFLLATNRKMTKSELRRLTKMSTSTFAKLGKNQMVSLEILVRICNVLHCQLSDICHVIDKGECGIE